MMRLLEALSLHTCQPFQTRDHLNRYFFPCGLIVDPRSAQLIVDDFLSPPRRHGFPTSPKLVHEIHHLERHVAPKDGYTIVLTRDSHFPNTPIKSYCAGCIEKGTRPEDLSALP